jgi:competence protein ComEC
LLTGDLEADGLLQLANEGWPLACTVLKVSHHGSVDALNEDLLAAMQRDLAVISVGADNLFGHPATSTLELLNQHGVRTLRADQAGDIEVIVNGHGWRVKTRNR